MNRREKCGHELTDRKHVLLKERGDRMVISSTKMEAFRDSRFWFMGAVYI